MRGVPMNGISALLKESAESSLAPVIGKDTARRSYL